MGLFGFKRRSEPAPEPMASTPGMFGGSYGGPKLNRMQVIGATLQQLGDNRGQLNDLYEREDKRQRDAFDLERQQAMLAALADNPAVPEQLRPFVPFAGKEIVGGIVGQAFKKPEAVRPVVTTPGAEIPEFDAYGRPVVDPATGMPRVLYRNQNFAPKAAQTPADDMPPGFVLD